MPSPPFVTLLHIPDRFTLIIPTEQIQTAMPPWRGDRQMIDVRIGNPTWNSTQARSLTRVSRPHISTHPHDGLSCSPSAEAVIVMQLAAVDFYAQPTRYLSKPRVMLIAKPTGTPASRPKAP